MTTLRIPFAHVERHIPASVGMQVNVDHEDCPAGTDTRQRLYVKRTHNAALAYCHNCGGHLVKKLGGSLKPHELAERLVKWAEEREKKNTPVELPPDCIAWPSSWPKEAAAWLYQYELDDNDIQNYSIQYSPSWGRVILPVYENGKLVFWQGRSIDGAGPKYISTKNSNKPLFTAFAKPGNTTLSVVVCEDMVSAIKLTKTGIDAVALLGTHAPDDLASRLEGYKTVYVWMDNDMTGRSKSVPIEQRLKTIGKNAVLRVFYETCPKDTPLSKMPTAVCL